MALRSTILFALLATTAAAEPRWEVRSFDMPESVLHDAARDRLVVSEIRGGPGDLDGAGGLVLLSTSGEVIDRAWAEGMNAPKGLALMGDRLLVADLDSLRVLDADTGATLDVLSPEGATFLNDVTVLGEAAYVTDLMTHTIWRYDGRELARWLEDDRLAHPNGIFAQGGRLIVGSWGAGLSEDFTTEAPGGLLTVDPVTQAIADLAPGLGNIDGIAEMNGELIVSDWVTGALLRVASNGSSETISIYPAGLADISATGSTVYLPHMLEGQVEAVALD